MGVVWLIVKLILKKEKVKVLVVNIMSIGIKKKVWNWGIGNFNVG